MTDPFVTSVAVESLGAHDHVRVFVHHQLAGSLILGKGEGERIRNVLLSERYFGTGRTPDGPIDTHEKMSWRVMATNWLDVKKVQTSETGFLGRMVLRLLDRIQDLEDHQERTTEPPPEYHGPSLVAKGQKLFIEDVPWFVKDFHVLYKAALRLAEACNGRGEDEGRPHPALKNLEAQLERLKPAYKESEAVRAVAVQGESKR